jgi:hypothetical protein
MPITHIERHGPHDLLARMRRVSMLTAPENLVYAEADMSLTTLHTDQIAPAQRYVLTQEIAKVRELRWSLLEHGVDMFNLDGYVSVQFDEYDEPIDLLPPVIEESVEADGTVVNILNDGMHRVFLARVQRSPIQVVVVKNVPRQWPYYAFPLSNSWNDVEIRQDLPEGYVKKWHRIRNYKSLYRNFNSAFQNVGGPRGHFANAAK